MTNYENNHMGMRFNENPQVISYNIHDPPSSALNTLSRSLSYTDLAVRTQSFQLLSSSSYGTAIASLVGFLNVYFRLHCGFHIKPCRMQACFYTGPHFQVQQCFFSSQLTTEWMNSLCASAFLPTAFT